MKQKEQSIYDFKKGDSITRIRPVIGGSNLTSEKDYSLVGKKVTFLGIANASVYLSKPGDLLTAILLGKDTLTIQIPLELCEDGWSYYIEPDFIDNESSISDDESTIQGEIQKAIKADEYEKADALKKKLDQIKKSRKSRGYRDEEED
jgi:hypothetical protein